MSSGLRAQVDPQSRKVLPAASDALQRSAAFLEEEAWLITIHQQHMKKRLFHRTQNRVFI
jgi:hypothetical protein